jgi:hypothetical protein
MGATANRFIPDVNDLNSQGLWQTVMPVNVWGLARQRPLLF